jgi:DNA excision repair protein ERCC-2
MPVSLPFSAGKASPTAGSPSRFDDGKSFLVDSPKPFFDDLQPMVRRLSVRYLLDKIESGRAIPDDPVEDFFAELGKFYSVLGMEGGEFSFVSDGESVKIVCKDASRQLAKRLAGFHSVIAMSATLEPVEFYEKMLGFDAERTDRLALPSPFPPTNRKVLVYHKVSTAFRHRGANYDKIAEVIATTVGVRAGNYMALFPSYEFLRAVARELVTANAVTLSEAKGLRRTGATTEILRFAQNDKFSEYELIAQEPKMIEAQREVVLEALKSIVPPKLVLAVQGGVFAEGVDYPGETLSGVIVVSPALPTVNFERELMRQYYQDKYGKGFEFAYLYPGMNRVIQSVGRLIRSETDTGVAVLVCQRFAQNQYAALFPSDWSEYGSSSLVCNDLRTELESFWQEKPFTSEGF